MIDAAAALDLELVPLIFANGMPSGPIERAAYDAITNERGAISEHT